jgi:chromate reductase
LKTVLAIAGSLRRRSYNRLLLAAAAECAPAEMVLSTCEAIGALPLFDEDLEAARPGGPDVVRRVRDEVARADGLLIATPEYNHSIPGVLKNAVDWLSRPGPEEVLVGKPVAIVGATRGRWGTRLAQAALRQVLYATESVVLPRFGVFVREAETAFDPSGRLVDASARDQLTEMLRAFSAWIDLVARGPRA